MVLYPNLLLPFPSCRIGVSAVRTRRFSTRAVVVVKVIVFLSTAVAIVFDGIGRRTA